MKYIETLKEGNRVSEVYLCKSRQTALTKAGKEYGNLVLQDKTGTIDSKIWDLNNPGIGDFNAMDYVHVDADVNLFMGSNQLIIKRIRRADPSEYTPSDYVPVTGKDITKMYQELCGYIHSLKNPYLKELAGGFFILDQDFAKAFQAHSAAKTVHHAFLGGLLEHTLSVVRLCDYFSGAYPMLNRDLLLTAAMFHDMGKLSELSGFPENDYTDEGQLIGHIVIGCEMVGERIRQIPGFPVKLAAELKHCILAHHGELEYGSPKKPALIEAMALNLADNADARLETMTELLKGAGSNQGWIGYNKFLETNIRKTSQD